MKNKKNLLFIITCFVTVSSIAQNKVYVYYLDKNFETAPKEKAVIVGKGSNIDSSFMVKFYVMKSNRLFLIDTYKDSTLAEANGLHITYYPDMKVSEKSNYKNNMLDGLSIKYDSLGRTTDSSVYENDKILYKEEQKYTNDNFPVNKKVTDSVANTMTDTDYDSTGKMQRQINFAGSKGVWKEYDNSGNIISTDSVFTRECTDSKFNGNWTRYLTTTLDPGVVITAGARSGSGTVVAEFFVNTDGTLSNIKTLTNVGYGAEEEVVRVLEMSPKWIPATRYGRVIKSPKKQPVTFVASQG